MNKFKAKLKTRLQQGLGINRSDLVFFSVLISSGIISRTVFHIGLNVELVTAISLAGGLFLRSRLLAFGLPIILLAMTDLLIGNSVILIFTWSAFLVAPLFGRFLKRRDNVLLFTGTGIVSVFIFYLWTNFGVVITTNMYSNNLQGLLHSYTNALPFLRNQIAANLIALPVVYFAMKSLIFLYNQKYHIIKNNLLASA